MEYEKSIIQIIDEAYYGKNDDLLKIEKKIGEIGRAHV